MTFASIPEAIQDFRQGKILVVVDDEDRENEGDLTIAADKITPDAYLTLMQTLFSQEAKEGKVPPLPPRTA